MILQFKRCVTCCEVYWLYCGTIALWNRGLWSETRFSWFLLTLFFHSSQLLSNHHIRLLLLPKNDIPTTYHVHLEFNKKLPRWPTALPRNWVSNIKNIIRMKYFVWTFFSVNASEMSSLRHCDVVLICFSFMIMPCGRYCCWFFRCVHPSTNVGGRERKGERQQKTQDNTFPPVPANHNAWPLEFGQFER